MHRLSPLAAALAAALACFTASADRPEYAWGKTFEVEQLADMVLDDDGNLYVALNEFIDLTPEQSGVTYHDNRIGRLHKYAPDGTLLWDKVIAGPRAVIEEIRFGLDGYLYVAGAMQGDGLFKPGEEAAPMSALLDEHVDAFGTRYTAPGLDDFLLRLSGEGDLNGAMLLGDPWFTPRSFDETEQLPEFLIGSGGTGAFRFAALADGYVHIYRTRRVLLEVLTIQRLGHSPTLHSGYRDGRLIRVHFDAVDVQHTAFYDYSVPSSGGMAVDPDGNLLLFGGFSRGHDFDPGPGEHQPDYPLTLPFSDGAMGAFWTLTPQFEFVRAGTYSTADALDSVSHYGYDGLSTGYAIAGTFFDGMTLDWTDENLVTVDLSGVYMGVHEAGHALLRFDADGEHIDTRTLPEVYREPGGVTYRYDLAKNAGRAPVNAAGALYLPYSLLHTVADPALEPPTRSVLLACDPPVDDCDTALIKFDDALEPEWHAVFTATRENDTDEISRLNRVLPAPSGAVYYASSYGGTSIDLDPTDGVDTAAVPPDGTLHFLVKLNDIAEPDVRSIVRAGTNPTKGPQVDFTVTYDEPVTGVDIDDFALTATGGVTGASIVSVTGADAVWTVTVDVGTGEGTLRLDAVDDDSIKSATDEPLGGPGLGNGAYTEGEAYTLDYTGPVAVITNIGPDYTIIPETQVVVTFDEPVTGLDAGDFLVTNGVVTDVTGSGTEYVVTIEITAPGDATVALIGGGAGDTAGNANGASAPLTVQFIDLNGDPTIPAAAWWTLGLLAAALAALAWRYRRAACLALALIACAPAYGDYPLLEWVRHHGEFVSSTVSDDDGNIYITGGILVENDTGLGGIMRDMFVAKYDPDGALIWETRMEQGGVIEDEGGTPIISRVWGQHIALGTDGSVYAAGVLGGRVTAEVAGEPFEYLHRWYLDTLPVLWRLTPDGDIEWMRTVRPGSFFQRGSLGTDSGQPVLTAAAPDGGVYFIGSVKVEGPVYLRPGPDSSTPFASIARTQPNPNVPQTVFVLRLNANGEMMWGHVLDYEVCSNVFLHDAPVGVAVSPEGDICIVGRFAGKADFDPAADSEAMLESQPIDDLWNPPLYRKCFAWILDADGELVQACAFGGPHIGPEGQQALAAAYLGAGRWAVSAALNTDNAEAAFTNGTIVPIAGLPQDTPFTHAVLVIHQDGTLDEVAPMAKAASLPHNDYHERPFGGHLAYGEPARTYYTSDIAAQPPGKWPGTPNGNFQSVQGYDGGALDWVLAIAEHYFAMWDLAAAPQNRFALAGQLGTVDQINETITADFDPYGPGMPSTLEAGFIAVYTDVATLDVQMTAPSGAAATPAQTAQFAVEFDEAAFNVAPEDFVLTADGVSGASITGLAGSGTSYVVTVDTGAGDGTLRLDVLDRDTILADDGVPLGGAGLGNGAFEDGALLTVDRTAPTVTIANIGPDYTIIPETQVVVTFNEPVTGLDASDFLVTNGVVTDVTGSGTEYVVTIEITAPGDATVALIGGGAGDTAGNANGASAPLTVRFIDLNGDPTIPAAAWWGLGILAASLAALGWRYRYRSSSLG